MIWPTMAVAAAGSVRSERADYARDARIMRAMALVVDLFVLGVITFVVNSVYGVTQPTSGVFTIGGGTYSTTVDWPWLTLVGVLYFAIPEAMFGATPGKAWARLRVVRLDGGPLGIASVLVRNLLKPIDFLPLLHLLGGFFVLFTRGSQRIGDIAAGTTVVYRHRALEPGATGTSSPKARRGLVAGLVAAIVFTMLFDYFGRPQLVIQGDHSAQIGEMRGVASYSLGQPHWGFGQVTYPITLQQQQLDALPPNNAVMSCKGSITLNWGWLGGWTSGSSGWSCGPTS
jgi:uncharacterized RDD family membrane protein YckC